MRIKSKLILKISILIFLILIVILINQVILQLKKNTELKQSLNVEIPATNDFDDFIVKDEYEQAEQNDITAPEKVVYSIQTAEAVNPRILEVEIEPWEVSMGEKQYLLVLVENTDPNEITESDKVSAVIRTNKKSSAIQFDLIRSVGENPAKTYWQGVWECNDDYSDHYEIYIQAESINGENSVVLTLR